MKFPLGLYVLSLLVVTALWWGLGRPEPMPNLQGEASGRPCLSYAPFRRDESPLVGDIQIDPARIAADLSQLATRTGCIRTYGVNHGTHLVPELAKQAGLKVMLGIWLAPERDRIAARSIPPLSWRSAIPMSSPPWWSATRCCSAAK
jgi:hypothetical protein